MGARDLRVTPPHVYPYRMAIGGRAEVLALSAVLMLLARAAEVFGEKPPQFLDYRDDRLTVRVQQVRLNEVLGEIGRETGADIWGEVRVPREVSAEFDGVPFAEALTRLLGDQNFTLRYDRNGELRAVELLGDAQPPTASARAAPDTSPPASMPAGPRLGASDITASRQLLQTADMPRNVSSSRRAARRGIAGGLRDGSPPSAQLSSAGNQAAGGAAPEDRLRRSLLNSLVEMDGPALSAFLESREGENVLGLVQFYATHHLGSTYQQKAATILQQLRFQASSPR